ncbi:DUF2161 family putative PD-(D/E)XK-type phosphodiesterase [Mesobacillus subterraneus]|uniref:DUF2161 domain-containing phosphodiesterase n=1 Tax=Mesobacillus subterraneus TaxID=285983 RepID=UPI0020402D11|nr:DUF2161 family putative PD-(D/E)XK-type phosphodiesterase [Mesobacillus subterraneus]MCM3575173.1 DUF2161 family putative PD-(D/E)XK-type phosphodiesterase [Mesobacillus subterraneus]
MTKLYEADLYEPIRKHFSKQGYRVNGEVHDCDLTAVKDEELIIVELKLNLNIDLLLQATRRQRLTDLVYIAIPKPKRISRKRWNDITQLVRRLELGLIIVSLAGNQKKIEFKVHPEPYKRMTSKNTRKKAALIKEIEGRSADYNIGGSNKTKIMTAYKENCIQIACYLEKLGQMSPKALVALGTGDKTPLILQKNYYKWFERVERGIYVITEQGKADLKDYPELVEYYLGGLKTED